MPLYLHLFHGRADPLDVLSDWGTDGPTIGPFDTLHVVYLSAVELHRDGVEFELSIRDGLVCFGGVFYGDYEVVAEPVSPPLSLERAEVLASAPSSASQSLLEHCGPLADVFLDAVRTEHGSELARRLETLLRISVA
jgi:hypothetical protein